jgi:pentose-5-phosphate-3-epimerase
VSVAADLAALPVVSSLSPLVRRYGGAIDVQLGGAADPGALAAVARAGGDSVTFQLENVEDVPLTVSAARASGLQVGCAFSASATAPELVAGRSAGVDLVRCNGGDVEAKVRCLGQLTRTLPPGVVIQAAGGIDHGNVRELYDAGARVLVVGHAIFEREDLPRAYRRLVQALA